MRIGNFVSVYPARSHTFIRRELNSLSAIGFETFRFSIRRMNTCEILDEVDLSEFQSTTPVYPLPLVFLIKELVYYLTCRPGSFFSSLYFALRFRSDECFGFVQSMKYFLGGIILAGYSRRSNIDILHAHFANAGACVCSIAAKLTGLKWGISLHGLSDFGSSSLRLLPHLINDASFVRCISKFGRSQAMLYSSKNNWEKIFVSYSGVPPIVPFQSSSEDSLEAHRAITLVTVGRLAPEKAHILLVQALSRIEIKRFNFKCLIVGDGPMRNDIEDAITQYQLNDRFFLIGAVSESSVRSYLAAADIFVLTSLMEGIPQVLMEAMQNGVPIVAPRVSGIPELVTDGVEGLLFTPGDEDSLVESLASLLSNSQLRRECGKAGRLKIETDFLSQTTISPLADAFKAHIQE